MDTTVRNLDERAYRELRARALLEGRTIGDMLSDAIHEYLLRATTIQKHGTLSALKPEAFPDGNERLSFEIDSIVYGQG